MPQPCFGLPVPCQCSLGSCHWPVGFCCSMCFRHLVGWLSNGLCCCLGLRPHSSPCWNWPSRCCPSWPCCRCLRHCCCPCPHRHSAAVATTETAARIARRHHCHDRALFRFHCLHHFPVAGPAAYAAAQTPSIGIAVAAAVAIPVSCATAGEPPSSLHRSRCRPLAISAVLPFPLPPALP